MQRDWLDMKMETNYQTEITAFKKAFSGFIQKKIVIYGIGRRTATLLPELNDWNIIGLMDKDPGLIGTKMFNYPIISLSEAEKHADLIIINAPQTYWKVIYSRISDSVIPVYYQDGSRAKTEKKSFKDNEYWNTSLEELKSVIDKYEIISFDIFDTLVMRRVMNPQDIWEITARRISTNYDIHIPSFVEYRKTAITRCNMDCPSIEDIYIQFAKLTGISRHVANLIKKCEIDVEESFIIVREDMLHAYDYAKKKNKRVYLVSDMHLNRHVICRLLKKVGIDVKEEQLFISCDKGCGKSDGKLWDVFLRDKSCETVLHIGDNIEADIIPVQNRGVATYKMMSAADMLKASAYANVFSKCVTLFDSIVLGQISARVFNSPFALNKKRGELFFNSPEQIGYSIFGPVICTYLMWIDEMLEHSPGSKVFFFGRDGFFLEQDYKYFQQLKNDYSNFSTYLETSRRATMVPNIVDEESLKDVVHFPYNGRFTDFMYDRFGIITDNRTEYLNSEIISTAVQFDLVYDTCKLYEIEIYQEAEKERKSYRNYLDKMQISEGDFVVDLFFYGNTQYYLSKLLGISLNGLYIACDRSEENRTTKTNTLFGCFQGENDVCAQNSLILKHCLLLESFLTAPTGMLKRIKDNGEFEYAPKGQNQKFFEMRERINVGVKEFIGDVYNDLCGIPLDQLFVDAWYGELMEAGFGTTEEVKAGFFFDNALIQRRELKILE